ncbi:tetratricopeptide repeat protein [Snuella sedimenti]|uniref:Tetratricopeptide repeat protein n=1 Tax=Snuella sedimenti TaxID=2798802 RepID=A0A8J7ILN3_9FLAO|nr:hypothetical protein [Snuella sedimenti]MBJ6366687.1 hypothetical protein [Snuella sedimenti]
MEEQDYTAFEAYLTNELSQEARINFETRLKADAEFNKAFNTYKELSAFLAHTLENETPSEAFKSNLENISNTHFSKYKKQKTVFALRPWQYAVAASIVLLIGIFMFDNLSNPQFNDYNNYQTISLTVRGDDSELIKTAEIAFNTKDFNKASKALNKLIALDAENAELKLYRAIANIELNEFDKADTELEGITKGNSVFKNKAIWYLALSKLKQKDYKACKAVLKTLSEEAEDFERAQKLLSKLD